MNTPMILNGRRKSVAIITELSPGLPDEVRANLTPAVQKCNHLSQSLLSVTVPQKKFDYSKSTRNLKDLEKKFRVIKYDLDQALSNKDDISNILTEATPNKVNLMEGKILYYRIACQSRDSPCRIRVKPLAENPYFVVRTSLTVAEPNQQKCDAMHISPTEIKVHARNHENFKVAYIFISFQAE